MGIGSSIKKDNKKKILKKKMKEKMKHIQNMLLISLKVHQINYIMQFLELKQIKKKEQVFLLN